MARKTFIDRQAAARREIMEAQAKLAKLQNQAAARIGRIAVRTGLADLGLSDAEIRSAFEELVFSRKTEECQ